MAYLRFTADWWKGPDGAGKGAGMKPLGARAEEGGGCAQAAVVQPHPERRAAAS